MQLRNRVLVWWLAGAVLCSAHAAPGQVAAGLVEANALDAAAKATFLETARVVRSRSIGQGVTSPLRLTLTDGTVTHDAAFQSIDERKAVVNFASGVKEYNFVDSHHFNLAAYTIAGLVGLDGMMPVTVHRDWNGKSGTATWWVDDAFDERTRVMEKRQPPNPVRWSWQVHRMRVFAALVGDSDRNLGNVLITNDWRLWMIDFTRAFRLWPELQYPIDLSQIDRGVLERLRVLEPAKVRAVTAHCLSRYQVDAVMARRDALVEHFDKLVAEKGASAVLYGAPPPR